MDKAKYRMRMEGLSPEQQDLVLGEMPTVMLPTLHVYCVQGEDLGELAHSLVGDFKEEGTNHDRKVYKRPNHDRKGENDVYIYYWDDALARREKRDGPEFTGWIIGNKVGGLHVWAECEVDS